ncbi:2,3-bisphosphoglycerate-independent phosphoglycerate mutase [Salibacter sp.]|uniref:2,3-bisphosphoglycerate-independent phosphoglycerate mutase n=1 Tax=Salibacter sp. TaxID=2010995 RepID=UPI002870103C|nr:2,3-bisphosphoglycerate-independent phosphoglycerate mutase [Salibacter sp.]MDR9398292.1 2,3-bisphosphoglycerate-independent phosphoglycerate mutase [Salibacter sp.]MDR9487698.1 2,3-bisphosphoglycerate-independent phosphoglycerate mutase [Salibacter sp.]
MNNRVVLMILDGWGIANDKNVSAIDKANTPFIDSLYDKYPHNTLETSGMAVGLPDGQMGNSEVGHMNLGAGRVVYQDLVKINKAVDDGSIGQNQVLQAAFQHAKESGKNLHFIGLVSDGGVHSHMNHLVGLTKEAAKTGLENIYIHAFTDGRDCDPHSGKSFIEKLEKDISKTPAKIASIVGRYYAMDRDKRWERIKLAYDAMVHGKGAKFESAVEGIKASYDNDVTDEFIKPIVLQNEDHEPVATISDGDVVINFNFRTDRGRQISMALTQQDFPEQEMKKLDLYYCTMTRYDDTFKNVHVIFEKDNLKNTIGEVIAKAGKKQIRIAETEKYPHVTFFFSGGREEPFENEKRIMVNSPKVATYDLQPEMSAPEVTAKITAELENEWPDFVCLNFANPDMVGHTGVFEAAVKACETVDQSVKQVVETGLKHGYEFFIIADHGNSDCMINDDGSPNTAHTTNPVPCIFVTGSDQKIDLRHGKLGDLAPTILKRMEIDIPVEMTGNQLI